MSTPPLELTDLTKRFGKKTAVDHVSMSVGEGEIVGFLGPNGAGKTSTLRMALGILPPDSGSAKLFGAPPGPAAFGRVGFLPKNAGCTAKARRAARLPIWPALTG